MNVFISWSGHRSRHVATALRAWLPKVIQAVSPWMSEQDISSGERWSESIRDQLSEARFGILCVTPENAEAPWLNFEAGALAKGIERSDAYVVPYLIAMKRQDLPAGPLTQFQSRLASQQDTELLVRDINQVLDRPVQESDLPEIFGTWWPKFEAELEGLPQAPSDAARERSPDEMIPEILEIVRELRRKDDSRMSDYGLIVEGAISRPAKGTQVQIDVDG